MPWRRRSVATFGVAPSMASGLTVLERTRRPIGSYGREEAYYSSMRITRDSGTTPS